MGKVNLLQPDHELEKILLDRENIPVLEHLIEKEGSLFARLEKLKLEGKLDFGKEMVQAGICDELEEGAVEEVYNILEKAQLDINRFLHTKIKFSKSGELMLMERGTGNGYNPDGPTIAVEMTNTVELTANMAHEYAHHVQYSVLPFLKKDYNKYRYQIFKEGHARGVERYISKLYNKKETNEAFLYDITNRNLYELLSAYKWLCFALDIKPSAKAVGYGRYYLSDEDRKCPLDPWTKGNALFYIQETLHGNGIYREVLKENKR